MVNHWFPKPGLQVRVLLGPQCKTSSEVKLITRSAVGGGEEKIEKHKKIIESIKGWRDKLFAHEDEEVFLDMDNFYKTYPLKHGEIEDLIKLSKEILGDIRSTVSGVGHSYSYKTFVDESELDVESIMDKLSEDNS